MEDIQGLVKTLSESIARDLVTRRGKELTDTAIAFEVAYALEELDSVDGGRFVELVKSYIKVADVHVSIPSYRVKDDGTVKTDDELKQEFDKEIF